MLKIFKYTISLLILTSCASTENIPMDMAQLDASNPQTVTTTMREKPDFSARTAGKAGLIGGLVGASAMIVAGNEIIQENDVDDPASYISNELAEALAIKINLEKVSNNGIITDSSSLSDLSSTYSQGDLLIDVQTIGWGFSYFPMDWNNYRVGYSAKLRLIDTKSNTTIAEGFCSREPDQDDKSPSYDEMLSDNAARIKKELKIAADYCINEFKTNVLKI